ncbi:TPA: hypothetical protein ACH3X2_000947 [Trebouxia sp. C0005]
MTSPSADQAVKVLQQVMSATCADTAFSAALSVLDDYLALATSMDDRIGILEREQARLKALAVFRESIEVFQEFVAEGVGRACWTKLSSELYIESFKPPKKQLVRQDMAKTLTAMNMGILMWDDVRQVADAAAKGCCQGKKIHPMHLQACVSQGVLPNDLRRFDDAMSAMLGWLATKVS